MGRLKDMGVPIAVDDFGTGHSSLAYLKRLPIGKLKIDKSFIRDIARSEEDASITRAIVEMARALRLQVVAEGVETREQLLLLRKDRCHAIQGYYVSPPLPADEFMRLAGIGMRFTN